MTLNYLQLIREESQTAKELNYLDQLINSNCNLHEEYPQLFHNEDSLFRPDEMYGEDPPRIQVQERKGQSKGKAEDKKEKNKEMFQQYLDSLDINQFLQLQGQIDKCSKMFTSKSNKNLESSLQCTFKPSILKKSNEIAEGLKPSFERLTMQVRNQAKKIPYKPVTKEIQKQYSKQRIERLSKPRVLKTEPSQNVEYRKIETQKKYFIPRSSNYLDVATRNQLWEEQKQNKIEKMRKEEQQLRQKKEKSTFVPKLTQYRGEKSANLSNFAKEGMANYFERLNKSKNSTYTGKENNNSFRRESSPYCSNNTSKTPKKQSIGDVKKVNQKIKYDDAVKELHKKLMSLNI